MLAARPGFSTMFFCDGFRGTIIEVPATPSAGNRMRFKRKENTKEAVGGTVHSSKSVMLNSPHFASGDDATTGHAQRMFAILSGLRYSDLSTSRQFDILQQWQAFAVQMRRGLKRRLVDCSFPLQPYQMSLWRQCADAYRLLADCYRRLAEDIAAQAAVTVVDSGRLSQCCFRGISCLGEYIVVRHECYLAVNTGVWLGIHKLYDIAATEGLEQVILREDGQQDRVRTVDDVYKRVLLLGLSDPLQYPFRGVARVYEKLDEWASLTYLATAAKPATRCLFVVDPRLDRPATPVLSQAGLRPEYNQKWLVTKELVTQLKREYDTALNQSAEHYHQHGSTADELGSIDFLRRMIVRWGRHPVRAGARNKTLKSCVLVAGLKSVCLALDRFQAGEFDEQLNQDIGAERFGHEQRRIPVDVPIKNGWDIEDESENGLKLTCGPSGSHGVNVDDLVAVRAGHAPEWAVGTVHWAQSDESGSVALGVRLIKYDTVKPVSITRLRENSDGPADQTRREALLLVDKSGAGITRSLFCEPSVYYPAGRYLVRLPDGWGQFVIVATSILFSSRSFVWFEVIRPKAEIVRKVLAGVQRRR